MNATVADLVTKLTTLRAEFAAHEYANALVGQPFIVATPDAALALRVEGNVATPINVRPHQCGYTCMTRQDATRIAALRGDGYVVMAYRDVSRVRVAAIDEMLAGLATVD
jgi:hypothetical protein